MLPGIAHGLKELPFWWAITAKVSPGDGHYVVSILLLPSDECLVWSLTEFLLIWDHDRFYGSATFLRREEPL